MKKKETILVTGGAGFIGSHLCERLIREGKNVICLDNFSDFYNHRLKKDNIKNLKKDKKFSLARGDILDKNLLEKFFQKIKFQKLSIWQRFPASGNQYQIP